MAIIDSFNEQINFLLSLINFYKTLATFLHSVYGIILIPTLKVQNISFGSHKIASLKRPYTFFTIDFYDSISYFTSKTFIF